MRINHTDASDRSIDFINDRFSGSTVLRMLHHLSSLRLVLRTWFTRAFYACRYRLNGFMTSQLGLSAVETAPDFYPVPVQETGNKPSLGKDQAVRIGLIAT